MMNRKVDVLIYSGFGSSTDSVRHCLYSLRRLLSPNYAVIPVTERTILKEPWTKSCALLVFPGGADTGYCKSLNGDGNRIIDQYVRRGGAYLGFCAGGYFGSSRCEFEVGNRLLEVIGSRELSFFPGTCRGCAFEGFEYDSEAGAKAVEIIIPGHVLGSTTTAYKFKSYYNGGGVFVDAAKYSDKNVEILGRYNGPLNVNGGDGNAAVVYCRVNKGKVILTGPHPEFAAANLDTKSKIPSYQEIIKELAENDSARVLFLKACLTKLGLSVNQEDQPIHSLSRLHLSSIQHELVPKLLSSWQTIITTHDDGDDDDGKEFIEAENDMFYLEDPDFKYGTECTTKNKSHSKHLENESNGSIDTYGLISRDNKNQVSCGSTIKHLVLHKKKWPNVKETPKFNHEVFFTSLKEFQDEKGSKADEFGKFLLYGEVVTSTNTILELNPKLLSQLPTGFTFTATTQVAGRGRGSNLWVSPGGSLNMSVYIKHPLALNATAPVIFVQYVAAMAIVQGIHSYEKGFENLPVKLKWPNDIYIKDPSKMYTIDKNDNSSSFSRTPNNENDNDLKSYIKVGGILINSSCIDENFHLVVGIGLNTTNDAPTTSLNSLLKHSMYKKSNSQNRSSPYTSSPSPQSYCELYFIPEKLLARILTCFETLYKKFCLNGFDSSFHTLYYSYWLHTNQIVTLETEGCARVRIKGITSDWGLLKVEELSIHEDRPTGKIWNLQSDCNSFDFFKGLLKAKN